MVIFIRKLEINEERGLILLVKRLTKKEWLCFKEYIEDLLELLSEEVDTTTINDNNNSYTKQELMILHDKIINNLENDGIF